MGIYTIPEDTVAIRMVLRGILAMFVVGAMIDLVVPNVIADVGVIFGITPVGVFISVAVGAFVAQRNFLIPALAITAIYTVFVAYKTSSTFRINSVLHVLSTDVDGIVINLLSATLGALLGMWLSARLR